MNLRDSSPWTVLQEVGWCLAFLPLEFVWGLPLRHVGALCYEAAAANGRSSSPFCHGEAEEQNIPLASSDESSLPAPGEESNLFV